MYADALCLTGSREEASDLVVKAYVRAFQEYQQEYQHQEHQRAAGGRVPPRRWTRGTLAWLYGNLHAVFCEGILGRAARDVSSTGGEL